MTTKPTSTKPWIPCSPDQKRTLVPDRRTIHARRFQEQIQQIQEIKYRITDSPIPLPTPFRNPILQIWISRFRPSADDAEDLLALYIEHYGGLGWNGRVLAVHTEFPQMLIVPIPNNIDLPIANAALRESMFKPPRLLILGLYPLKWHSNDHLHHVRLLPQETIHLKLLHPSPRGFLIFFRQERKLTSNTEKRINHVSLCSRLGTFIMDEI